MDSRQLGKKCYVFAYVDPDTDGVGSAICYANWLSRRYGVAAEPVVFGAINRETNFVLRTLHIQAPGIVTGLPAESAAVLVDTHHINQLPPTLDPKVVVEVLDHHPAGNPEAFPNAVITNEVIGAVATLVCERYKECGVDLSPSLAGLLYASIISNTLYFRAPTTTERDRSALEWLEPQVNGPSGFIDAMFQARSDLSNRPTLDILLSDYKEFEFAKTKVGIAQLETTDLEGFLIRADLVDSLEKIRCFKGVQHVFFNGADILRERGVLIAHNPDTQAILNQALQAQFEGDRALFGRILLRKSDLVPQLARYFESQRA